MPNMDKKTGDKADAQADERIPAERQSNCGADGHKSDGFLKNARR